MTRVKKISTILWIVAALISQGCLGNEQVITATSSPQSTSEISETETVDPVPTVGMDPTLAYIATNYVPQISYLTPPPTVSSSAIESLYQLLNLDSCRAPCYLSITPGKTELAYAVEVMQNLGAGLYMQKPSPYALPASFAFYTTDGKGVNDPSISTVVGGQEIAQNLDFITTDGIVQRIDLSLQTIKYVSEFKEKWKQYSIREIMMQNGMPDAVSFSKGTNEDVYELGFYYASKGISFDFAGTGQDGQICPNDEQLGVRLHLIFTNPESTLGVFSSGVDALNNGDYWNSIDKVLNITKDDFYNQMIASESTCFKLFRIGN